MSTEHPARRAGLASQNAVKSDDRAAWLALFAPDAIIQDPVGPSPLNPDGNGHQGLDAIARFYDQVIAGSGAEFVVDKSFASGDECAFVGRIVTERAGMPRTEVELVAVYRVDADGKLLSLRAFWEFDALIARLQEAQTP